MKRPPQDTQAMKVICGYDHSRWDRGTMAEGCSSLWSGTRHSHSTEVSLPFYLPLNSPPTASSNVNSMPVEMLHEIFTKVMEVELSSSVCFTDCPESDGTLSNYLPYPVVLSQVCSLWRQVALSTPSLWSTICVMPSSKYQASQMHWTKLFLSRAESHPLDLVLKDCRSRSTTATSSGCREICATRSILSLLVSRVRFWRSIDFHVSHEVLDILFTNAAPSKRIKRNILHSASLLVSKETCEKLPADHLSSPISFINGTWANPFLATVWTYFFSSPNMIEMTWWPGFHRIFTNPPVDMFDQLVRLNVHYSISPKELLHVLVYVPNIKEVVVTNLRLQSRAEILSSPPRLLFGSLESLLLRAAVEVGPFFDGIIAPSLLSLDLHYFDFQIPDVEDNLSLRRFFEASECRLKIFVIRHDAEQCQ